MKSTLLQSGNTVFLDIILSILVGALALFFISIILLNDPTKKGKIDPIAEIMVTARWPDNSKADIDLWMAGPDNSTIGFRRKDGRFMNLDRDDLGVVNDKVIIDGVEKIVRLNLETIKINAIVPGDYVLNIHFYSGTVEVVPVTVEMFDLRPTIKVVYSDTYQLPYHMEHTVITFSVDPTGNVYNVSQQLQIPIFGKFKSDIANPTGMTPPPLIYHERQPG